MKKKLLCLALAGMLALGLLAGCGAAKAAIYPVTVDGTAVTAGETTASVLYDAGFDLHTADGYAIERAEKLDADSYYTGTYFGKDGVTYGALELVTDEACPVGGAVIASIKIMESGVPMAQLNGIDLTALTPEKAREVEPKLEDGEYWQSYVTGDTILRIERTEGAAGDVQQLEMAQRYDVDYSSNS